MTWSLVGAPGTLTNLSGAGSVPCGQASTAGSLLACWVAQINNTAPTLPAGWTLVASNTAQANNAVWIYAYFGNPGSISSLSVTPAATSNWQVGEFTCPGVASVAAADQTGSVNNTSPVSPLNVVTGGNLSAANELALSVGSMRNTTANASTVAPGSGFTAAGLVSSGVSAAYHKAFDYRLDTGASAGATVTDAIAFSITGAGNEVGCIAAFAQPPAGGLLWRPPPPSFVPVARASYW